jgi:hypothetical protein
MADYDFDEMYPGRFIKAALLKGKPATLTIAEVELELMPDPKAKGGKANKVIMSFVERDRQLLVNKTNALCLVEMFGRRSSMWIGKRITLQPDIVLAWGVRKPCIRISGSPDIEKDVRVMLRAGQEEYSKVMKRTGGGKRAAPTQPPELEEEPLDEPGSDYDPSTGEVPFETNGGA